MGFLKKKFLIITFCSLIFFGCAPSGIKVSNQNIKNYLGNTDSIGVTMFGKIPSRNFFVEKEISSNVKQLWKNSVNGGFDNTSITSLKNYIFVSDQSGRIYCFDLNSGKQIGLLRNKGNINVAPIINNFNIIFPINQLNKNLTKIIFYDFYDGKISEEITIEGKIINEAVCDSNELFFITEEGVIHSFSFWGRKNYNIETKSFVHSSPVLFNSNLIFGNDNGEILIVDYKLKKIVQHKISDKPLYNCSIKDSLFFIGSDDGNLYCFDLNTKKIKWKFDSGSTIKMFPTFDSTNLFFGNLRGEFFSLRIDDGLLNWKIKKSGIFNATPLVFMNLIIAPNLEKMIFFIDKNNGNTLNELNYKTRVKLSPFYYNNILIIGIDRGELIAYQIQ
ncbi:MAG: hypothetical protein STSR0008_02190 [Ignavibacterium sp.]